MQPNLHKAERILNQPPLGKNRHTPRLCGRGIEGCCSGWSYTTFYVAVKTYDRVYHALANAEELNRFNNKKCT